MHNLWMDAGSRFLRHSAYRDGGTGATTAAGANLNITGVTQTVHWHKFAGEHVLRHRRGWLYDTNDYRIKRCFVKWGSCSPGADITQ